ncbi:T9SS-dependent choice-of-anchor J family protein [Flavimarina sp. Hel_I_48]|uniref:T9SS-dependent choice-of-anchor J family protein n=1 Tax=Flavimarina sp. Hel_I_48 TaxID=1392488 RepID=UPI0004DF67A9|nr:choice-of-anchor J domain-containing protein [Flavimarina sp. Hel_I_48]
MNALPYFLLILFITFSTNGYSQIASADFNDGQFPSGWSTIVNSGPCDWDTFTNDPPRGLNFSSTALIFNDEACGNNNSPSRVSLLTPVYNVANTTPLLLTVEIGLWGEDQGETLRIEVYDGTSWVVIKTFNDNWNPYLYQADVTGYANTAFRVRFVYNDNGRWSYYAGIDNFSLTQEELPDSPEQSTCASAEDISPGIHTVAPIQRGDSPNICDPTSKARGGAWFTYTATRDGIATVNSALSQNNDIDTNLSILTGSCGELQCYAQNDDQSGSIQFSSVSFEIENGSTYYIVFDDKNNNQGFDFSLTESEETCNPGERIAIDFTDLEEFQSCHTTLDGDGDGNSWNADGADFKRNGNVTYFALNSANQDRNKEDYLFSPKLSLIAGKAYNISFSYNGGNAPRDDANENLQVLMASSREKTADMTLVYEATGIVQQGTDATIYDNATNINDVSFTPQTTGDYYLTFKTTSAAPSGFLFLFDYSLEPDILSIETVETASVSHFYNAHDDQLSLQATSLLTAIELYSMQGQLLRSKKLQGLSAQFSLAGLADGIYIARAATVNGTSSFKILKR